MPVQHFPASMGSVRAAFASAPTVGLKELTGLLPVLVIAPHADDETLGCGGLIAQLAQQGVPITVALLTDGARSHPGSLRFPDKALRALREEELRAALGALGASASEIVLFREPDGFLHRSDLEAIAARLRGVAEANGIRTIFVTWGADPHPDHQAAAAISRMLAILLPEVSVYAYPIWGLTLPDDAVIEAEHQGAVKLDVRAQSDAKARAVAAHASQTTEMIDDSAESFRLTDEHLRAMCGPYEIFIPMRPRSLRPRSSGAAGAGGSVPRQHFDALYDRAADPWEYETNAYETEKYDRTLGMLPRPRYGRALELGCSIGVLTARLADRCNELVGADCANAAVLAARRRLAGLHHVSIVELQAPSEMPEGLFDLIVLSEVLYFFDDADLAAIADFVLERLNPGGDCILVNFLGDTESPQTGDDAADAVLRRLAPRFPLTVQDRQENYRIDVVTRPEGERP